MSIETNAAPDVAADTATSDQQQNPEVAAPEDGDTPEQEPKDDPIKALEERLEKERKTFERRINRKHAEAAQATERARNLEAQLQRYAEQQGDEQPAKRDEPIDVRAAARELLEQERIAERSHEIKAALVKELGADGFAETLQAVIEEAGPLADERGKWTPLGEAIADSENAVALLKHLKDNPDVAAGLEGLSATRLGKRIASIEASIAKKEPQPSKAPKPLEPIKASGKSGVPSADSPDFMAWKLKQLSGR